MGISVTLLIFAVVFLAILIAILILIKVISRKTKQLARSIFGTNTLREGFEQVEAEYASTPKSVSAVTSLYLPKIVRDFPEFNLEQMKTRAENVLVSYLTAMDNGYAALPDDCSPEFKEQTALQIQQNRDKHIDTKCDNIKIHRTEICSYRKTPGRCTVTFQTALQFVDTRGMKQSKWNTEAIYTQDAQLTESTLDDSLGLNCPNCGAPITMLGSKICAYCGTPVLELNIHIWTFNNVQLVN